MNYFVEGLQGSGKSTLVRRLAEKHPGSAVFREGDHSPVELAWCARVSEAQYSRILKRWSSLKDQILNKTYKEGDHRIVCYTQIKSEDRDFYSQLEDHEIYNGRTAFEEYKEIVLSRYRSWQGENDIFECSLLQNAVEDMILFRDMSDDGILTFYEEVRSALAGKDYEIFYIETPDIEKNLDAVRKERVDKDGNEVWFDMLMGYFAASPYAKKRSLHKYEDLLLHLSHRQVLELRICRKIFPEKLTVLTSKAQDL
ncbi:MAG: hypothetical protein K5648_02310 [Erysipelotrichaceae bacterium]|nr:hypothetical protein [Erysipelotrichaceae bacterium]